MKQKSFRTNSSLIWYFTDGSKAYFATCMIFAVFTALFDLLLPRIMGVSVDSILGEELPDLSGIGITAAQMEKLAVLIRDHLWITALAAALSALLGAVSRFLFKFMNETGAETFVKNVRDILYVHIGRLPFSWFSENDTGDIIQRCTSDVETIKRFLSEQLTGLLRIIVLIITALLFMFMVSPVLMGVAAAFIPIVVGYSVVFHGRITSTFEKADEEEGILSTYAQENLTGVRVVRAFGREREEYEKFSRQNIIYTDAYIRLTRILSLFWSAGDFISGIQVLSVVALGSVLTVRGRITPGDYIACISYNTMLVWPVRQLGRVISEMSKAGVSMDRLRYIMNSEEEQDLPGAEASVPEGDIEFSHVTFRYHENGPDVLSDVSFTVKKGTVCGILGGTGSGKSTLMLLLKRLYPLTQGSITIGGRDITTIQADVLRRQVGMVLQEPYLFSGTLAQNIAITRKSLNDEEVREAAHVACLDKTIGHFENGYQTFVGERGVTLSGGQKQRTAIARMMIGHHPILIFDDSLSAVDAATDEQIRRRLRENVKDATVFIVSHRISTLMDADQILVLNRGRIVQKGNHETLSSQEGIYADICRIQSGQR